MRKRKKKADDPAEAIMKEGVEQALELAKDNKLKLDFTDKSIKTVEKILAECHREYRKSKDEDGFHGLAMMFGAYIGEVVKRKGLGGRWEKDHPDFGENAFPFYWRDDEDVLFPCAWCAKRIFDGEGDDVSFKYKALVLEALKEG